ncbi:MAG: GAF domain-containing protein [Candidatus Riflebacteria bacterium]|nr:GAF domain-containing protein [Candidatus Riflebacteria bacterium]
MARAYLKHKAGEYTLSGGICSIGREPSCTIFFDDQELSRKHALVVGFNGEYTLMDFKSSNGVEVNNRAVEQCRLHHGDIIKMGAQVFEFRKEQDPADVSRGAVRAGADPSKTGADKSRLFTMLDLAGAKALHTLAQPLPAEAQESEGTDEAVRKLLILYQVSKIITSELDVTPLLNKVIDLALEVMKADRGFIMLVDDQNGKLVPTVSRQMEGMMGKDGPIMVSRSIVDEVFEKGTPILTKDALVDPRFVTSGSIQMYNIRSAMCVPLVTKDRTVGVLYVDNRIQSDCFEEDDLKLLTAFGDQAAIAIDNARLYEAIEAETKQRENLSRYLSPDIVDKILAEKGDIGRGGQLVNATVLFCDIRGFTTFSEARRAQPQLVVGILNEYLEAMTASIFEYGGTLDKYLGDGMLAIFGAPFRAEDAPYRAVCAAMAMQMQMDRLCRQWMEKEGFWLLMGVGINTGEVVAGSIGSPKRMDYTVIGDCVNTASRVCSIAQGREILITDDTYQLVKDRIEVRDPRQLKVKGKNEPIVVYKVVRARRVGASSDSRVAATPLVTPVEGDPPGESA